MINNYVALVVKCVVGTAITVAVVAGIWYIGTAVLEELFSDEMEQ